MGFTHNVSVRFRGLESLFCADHHWQGFLCSSYADSQKPPNDNSMRHDTEMSPPDTSLPQIDLSGTQLFFLVAAPRSFSLVLGRIVQVSADSKLAMEGSPHSKTAMHAQAHNLGVPQLEPL